MGRRKRWILLALVVSLVTFAGVLALATNPSLYFTDNINAPGPSPGVTVMEQALLNRLDHATSTIDATIYDFNRASIRDALIAAHNRGVAVRVVTDDETYNGTGYHPYFAALEAAGIPIVNDNRASIMHNKFFIIDGQAVWSGSTNMSDNGFTFNHNNSLVFTSTELADIYTTEFEEMFVDGLFGTAKTDNTTHTLSVDGIPLEVYFSPSDGAMQQVIAEVASASESIVFSIFYFTDDDLRDALLERYQAGVSISGVWDELGAANPYSEDEALCAVGIPLKIENFGGKMHNKFMVIDAGGASPRVVTGSMNWTGAGGNANDENTLIIDDGDVAQSYLAAFQELYDALGPETLCHEQGGGVFVFLPAVMRDYPPLPTATPMPTGTPNPSATPQPTPTATQPPVGSGDIVIFNIFYDGSGSQEPDEHVDIRNQDTVPIQLSGWTLRDIANHVFTFPSFIIQPGQECRIYTNEFHPESCGFDYGSGSAIWNNSGDCAYLQDAADQLVDEYCYPSKVY